MTVLKALGIDQITPRIIVKVIVTVGLFGVTTNSLFELYKLIPTCFMEGNLIPDWRNILLYLLPLFLFFAWISFHYWEYKRLLRVIPESTLKQPLRPHQGIVLALSKPQKAPEDILKKIADIDVQEIVSLYSEWSIGQLFKGLYHHHEALLYIWPLMTEVSLPYKVCIEEFAKKFIPKARVICDKEFCHLTEMNDFQLIEETKSKLAKIYSKENLDSIDLESSDIMVDISGGTKTITIGMILGALDSAINIQYVEQQSKRYDVIPLAITPEIILDKIGEYLLDLYARMAAIRRKMNQCQQQ